jgi:hypothetical protein
MTRFVTITALLALGCLAAPALPAAGAAIPVAADDNVEINFGRRTPIDVLVNDAGIDDGPIVIEVTQQPLYGSVEVELQAGTFVTYIYSDSTAFASPDSFRYRLRDADGDVSNEAVVTAFPINVLTAQNDPDGYLTPDGPFRTTVDRVVTVDVLANDGGLLNSPIQLTITGTAEGTAVVNPDNTVTFAPNPGFTGTLAGFQYQLTDSTGATSLATANIQVFPAAVTDSGSSSVDPAVLALLAAGVFLRRGRLRR